MVASKQIAENYVETGRKKAELPVSHMLILGFFAGMFIALAGAGASVASAAMTNASASRIASALVFPAGLALVVCTGAGTFHWELPDDDLGAAETDFRGRVV